MTKLVITLLSRVYEQNIYHWDHVLLTESARAHWRELQAITGIDRLPSTLIMPTISRNMRHA